VSGVISRDPARYPCLLWLISDPGKLSKTATRKIEKARAEGEELAVVDITLLELATLVRKGRIGLAMSIGATAWAEGISFVTADAKIRKAKAFATIW
jgi:PIN domain nuclease of toxin-antitoxin system